MVVLVVIRLHFVWFVGDYYILCFRGYTIITTVVEVICKRRKEKKGNLIEMLKWLVSWINLIIS